MVLRQAIARGRGRTRSGGDGGLGFDNESHTGTLDFGVARALPAARGVPAAAATAAARREDEALDRSGDRRGRDRALGTGAAVVAGAVGAVGGCTVVVVDVGVGIRTTGSEVSAGHAAP